MKRPLWVAGSACLISGLVAFLLPVSFLTWGAGFLSAAGGILFFLRRKLPHFGSLIAAVALISGTVFLSVLLFWQFRYTPAAAGADIQQRVTGRVVSAVERGNGLSRFTLEVTEADALPAGTHIRLSTQADELCPGDMLCAYITPRLAVSGVFPLNPSMAAAGVYLYASAADVQISTGDGDLLERLYAFSEAFRDNFVLLLPGEQGGLAMATLFSDKSGLHMDTADAFSMVGTGHLFAVSGLHMTLLFSLLLAMLSPVLGRRAAGVAALLAAGLFLCMVGFRLSAIRAFVMLSVMTGAGFARRHHDSLNALGLAVLLIVLWNPAAVLDAGFLYSVSACVGVVGLSPHICRTVLLWTHAKSNPIKKILSALSVSLGAILAMLPVSAVFGGTISPYALLANLLIVPLVPAYVGLALLSGLIGLLPLPFFFSLGKVLVIPVRLLGGYFMLVAKGLYSLPCSSFSLDYPAVRMTALLAGGVLCLVFLLWEKRRKLLKRLLILALAAGILLGLLCASAVTGPDAVLVSQKSQPPLLALQSKGEWVLVAASLEEYPVRTLISTLRQRGVTRLAALVLLSDTIRPEGQAETLLAAFPSDIVVTDSPAFPDAKPITTYTPVCFGEISCPWTRSP